MLNLSPTFPLDPQELGDGAYLSEKQRITRQKKGTKT